MGVISCKFTIGLKKKSKFLNNLQCASGHWEFCDDLSARTAEANDAVLPRINLDNHGLAFNWPKRFAETDNPGVHALYRA